MKYLILFLPLVFLWGAAPALPETCEAKTPSLIDGKKHGPEWECHDNGRWKKALSWENGNEEGKLIYWAENGQKIKEGIVKDGKVVKATKF